MSALGTKLRQAEGGGLIFWCPGCDGAHVVWTGERSGPSWHWNGSGDAPTFNPSILVRGTVPITDAQHAQIMAGHPIEPRPTVCHFFVTDGRIQFLGDCSHDLAGQAVDLPDWEAHK